ALQVFGGSIRESNCDCDRSMEASLLQTVYLRNDSSVIQGIDQDRNSWVAQITRPTDSSSKGSGPRTNLAQMKTRLEQARKAGNEQQVKRMEERIAELEKSPGGKNDGVGGGLTLDESTLIRHAYL